MTNAVVLIEDEEFGVPFCVKNNVFFTVFLVLTDFSGDINR